MPGDPLKNLDWKVLAKSDRYLIKQYTEETNLRAHLLVDLSGSMGFKSERASLSKLEYARSLAAALAYISRTRWARCCSPTGRCGTSRRVRCARTWTWS
jgi:uncharacterized protein (DUF58 family)